MFDLPLPFNPVIALNCGSNPETVVRVAYDLKPSITTCLMYIFKQKRSQKKNINRFIEARRLVARSCRQNLPIRHCCQWICFSAQPTRTSPTQPAHLETLITGAGNIKLLSEHNFRSFPYLFSVANLGEGPGPPLF